MNRKLKLGKADIRPMDPKDVRKIRGGNEISEPGDSFSISASASGSLSLGYAETDVEVEVEAEVEF